MFVFKTVLLIEQISRRPLSGVNWPKKSDSEEKYAVIASIVDTLHRMVFSQEIKLSQSQAFSLLPGKQFISHWKQPKKFTGARKRQKRREFMCFTCSRFYGLLVIGKIFLSLNLHVLIKSGILKALNLKCTWMIWKKTALGFWFFF